MADESERPERNSFHHKRKHKNDPQPKKGKEKKSTHQERKPKRKKTEFIQPRAPKTAAEMSSNWKALQAVSGFMKVTNENMYKTCINYSIKRLLWYNHIVKDALCPFSFRYSKTKESKKKKMGKSNIRVERHSKKSSNQ